VLLLEDDLPTRQMLTLVLDDEGIQTRVCGSPEQAIQAARDLAAPLLIADFWGTSHHTLLPDERAEIRSLADAVPTIMVTARAWAARSAAADLGLVALVRKPIEPGQIRSLVVGWVEQSRRDSAAAMATAHAIRVRLDSALTRANAASTALKHAARRARGAGLTRREIQVAALVAEGLTNSEIGERLVVTTGTVANHVRHISLRLGLRNRVQLAVWAVEHGLYRSDGRMLADGQPQPAGDLPADRHVRDGSGRPARPAPSVDGSPYG
jgi:DNA-binding NarL/FixJ family response regulator